MGREQVRIVTCAVASLALIVAGALVMDWYQIAIEGAGPVSRVGIDLRSVHACSVDHICATRSLTTVTGMFPTLAAVTLWSSLGFAALVAFQTGARLLAGAAQDVFTRLGYMLALMAISLAVATAFLFGPEHEGVTRAIAAQVTFAIHRTAAPAVLIAGLALGFVAVYLAVARESSDLGASYRPITLPPGALEPRTRTASMPVANPGAPRESTGMLRMARGTAPPAEPGPPALAARTRSGPVSVPPEHLRNRLRYVAVTAELTVGGIDARREDGLARLILWRDVVGVVARRMPPIYDRAAFVDIISTAGSTLRIVPWTRLTGERIEGDGDGQGESESGARPDGEARPRALIEHVAARCPSVQLDPATQRFRDDGELAQLPDLETLRAHDDRLA